MGKRTEDSFIQKLSGGTIVFLNESDPILFLGDELQKFSIAKLFVLYTCIKKEIWYNRLVRNIILEV